MMSLEYLAGLFDGEGTVRYQGNSTNGGYSLHVGIANTYRPILVSVQQEFGGTIEQMQGPSRKEHWRPTYYWRVEGNKARAFLGAILPYLQEKKPQAELALQMPHKRLGNKTRTPEVIASQEAIRLEIQRLKRISY